RAGARSDARSLVLIEAQPEIGDDLPRRGEREPGVRRDTRGQVGAREQRLQLVVHRQHRALGLGQRAGEQVVGFGGTVFGSVFDASCFGRLSTTRRALSSKRGSVPGAARPTLNRSPSWASASSRPRLSQSADGSPVNPWRISTFTAISSVSWTRST